MPTYKQYHDRFLEVLYEDALWSNERLAEALAKAAVELDKKKPLTEKETEQANALVDAILENDAAVKSGKVRHYENREKMPAQYLDFSDTYNELTGQIPTKRVFQDWMMTFNEWIGEGLTSEHIRAAYEHSQGPKGGFLVSRPGALTNTAVAMKSKPRQASFSPQIYRAEDHPEPQYVPMPESARAALRGLVGKATIK